MKAVTVERAFPLYRDVSDEIDFLVEYMPCVSEFVPNTTMSHANVTKRWRRGAVMRTDGENIWTPAEYFMRMIGTLRTHMSFSIKPE